MTAYGSDDVVRDDLWRDPDATLHEVVGVFASPIVVFRRVRDGRLVIRELHGADLAAWERLDMRAAR